jgi:hypothetical protein
VLEFDHHNETDSSAASWLALVKRGALGFSLAHTFVDYHIGLYGESSSSISLLQATNVAVTSLVVACIRPRRRKLLFEFPPVSYSRHLRGSPLSLNGVGSYSYLVNLVADRVSTWSNQLYGQ